MRKRYSGIGEDARHLTAKCFLVGLGILCILLSSCARRTVRTLPTTASTPHASGDLRPEATTTAANEIIQSSPKELQLPTTHDTDRVSTAPSGRITASLNATLYDRDTPLLLTVANSTDEVIALVGRPGERGCYTDALEVYARTNVGWLTPSLATVSYICEIYVIDQTVWTDVPAGLEKQFNIGFLKTTRDLVVQPYIYQLRVKYVDSRGGELVLYTNEFSFGRKVREDIRVSVDLGDGLHFGVVNNSGLPLWLSPLCSTDTLIRGWIDKENTTPQRLTSVGSWVDIQVEPADCLAPIEPIRIDSGEVEFVDGAAWIQQAGLTLEPGRYRWDVLLFLERSEWGVEDGRHVFSELFELD